MSAAIVRAATLTDAATTGRIHVETWQSAYAGLVPDAPLAALSVAERIALHRQWLAAPTPATGFFVADVSGVVRGFCLCGPSRTEGDVAWGKVHALYVEATAAGRGLGAALLNRAEAWLRERGCPWGELAVLHGNTAAAGFYRHQGWAATGALRREVWYGVALVEERFVKALG